MSSRKRPFTPEEFKRIYSQVPRLTVEVILQTNQGIPLIKRQEQSWHGKWHIPGGTVLYKETLEQAVKRIAAEELGVIVKIKKLLGYIEYPSEEQERGFGWSIGIAFLCHVEDETKIDFELWQKNQIQFFTEVPDGIVSEQKKIFWDAIKNN